MQKWIKRLAIVVIVFIVILVGIYIFFSIYFTPQRLKALVVPRLTAALGREVEIKEIRFNLFKGLEVKEFSVKEATGFPIEQFISCEKLILRYRFWPLFRKKIEIGKLILESPQIEIIKNIQGRFNFEDVVSQFKKKEALAPSPSKKDEKAGMAFALFISEVKVKDGTAVFRDLKQPTSITLKKTDFVARDISLTHSFPIELSCLLNEVSVTIEGKVNLATLKTDLKIKAFASDLSSLFPVLPPGKLNDLRGKAGLKVDLKTEGINNAQAKGILEAKNVSFISQKRDYENLNIDSKFDLLWNGNQQKVVLNKVHSLLNGFSLDTAGSIGKKEMKLKFDIPLQSLKPLIKLTIETETIKVKKGQISANLAVQGNPYQLTSLELNGDVSLQDVSLKLKDMPPILSVKGKLSLQKQDAIFTIPLSGKIGNTYFKLNGKVKHFFDKPIVTLNAEFNKLKLEEWLSLSFPKKLNTSEVVNNKNQSKKQDKEPAPLNLPFVASGQIKISDLSYKKIIVSKFTTTYNFKDNVLVLKPIYGQFQKGGTIKGKIKLDLSKRGFIYDLDLNLDKIDINNFTQSLLSPSVGELRGKGSLITKIKGKGITAPSLEKYLNGWINASFANGELRGNPILQEVAEFLDIKALTNPKFKEFKSNLEVENGKINIKGKMKERDYGFFLQGSSTVTGKLDLQSDITLNANLVQNSKAKQIFKIVPRNEEGYYFVPLLIKGKFNAPKIALNTKAIGEKVKEEAQKNLEKVLKKQIEKRPLKDLLF
ncbi:MAG: AsmA family protein [Candidatus Desulfofervidus auxilii]|nr:AsmA family protein [Candidatus Desulfofervidus auxilii]